jgi:hypothetical protein
MSLVHVEQYNLGQIEFMTNNESADLKEITRLVVEIVLGRVY